MLSIINTDCVSSFLIDGFSAVEKRTVQKAGYASLNEVVIKIAYFRRDLDAVSMLGTRLFNATQAKESLFS